MGWQYVKWVHTPYYFKEDPRHMRFFESDVLEMFSKVRTAPTVAAPIFEYVAHFFLLPMTGRDRRRMLVAGVCVC